MNAKFIHHRAASLHSETKSRRAFTRVELAAVIAGLTLLCVVALPLLGTTRGDADRATCFNNLRLMGRAVQMWGADHRDEPPWQTYDDQGGTRPRTATKPGDAWYEFSWMSDELVTPRILACPADSSLVARDFGEYRIGNFRRFATSYFLNLHTTFEYSRGALFGDRNVRFALQGGCEFGVDNAVRASPTDTNVGWTNAVHGFQGNIVRMDGSAEQTSSEELRSAFRRSDRIESPHFLRGGP